MKIFDDDDCEGDGSDDDSGSDDDESYEDQVDDDDDSDDQDDLMSSGDDDDNGAKKKAEDIVTKDVVEKASFQTALDIPEDDVKVVKPNDQASPKAVEVIQVADDKAKGPEADAGDSKEAKKD